MTERTHVIIITETVMQSWARDASTLAMFVALIGIGIWTDSIAMQWVGGVIGFLTIIALKASSRSRMTIEQARARLDEIEREAA
jgi:hypothetical protein